MIEQVEEKGKLQDAMIDSIMSTIKTHKAEHQQYYTGVFLGNLVGLFKHRPHLMHTSHQVSTRVH